MISLSRGLSLQQIIRLSAFFAAIVVIFGKVLSAIPVTMNQDKASVAGCARKDNRRPSLYLSRDATWNDDEIIRMVLHNNSNCPIILTTIGKQLIIKPNGKTYQVSSDMAEDGAMVTLLYKINSEQEPWAFMAYWPYGDTVSSLQLNGGHTISFAVRSDHLKNIRQIAVPFHYEWEGVSGGSGIEHLVYSQID